MLTALSSLAGFAAVALGAFGAHALEGKLDVKAEGWWDTATLYLLVHAVAGLVVGLALPGSGLARIAGLCLVLGAGVFAGTLYAMALGAPRVLGAVTPLGGTVMLVGWGLMAWIGIRGSF